MNRPATYRIQDFIFDLTEIASSDILVDIQNKQTEIYEIVENLEDEIIIPLNATISSLLKIAQQHKRTSDTNSLCISVGSMEWEYKNKKVNSPLFLIPVIAKYNKITQEIAFTLWFENCLINPFVRNELFRNYALEWEPQKEDSIQNKYLNFIEFAKKEKLNTSFNNRVYLGNFHYHRFLIIKELETIENSKTNHLVEEILGNEAEKKLETQNNLTKKLVNSDAEQNEVLTKYKTNNIVIQGPPGTGKSQTLTNIIAQSFDSTKLKLIVSEKRAALEVLVKKLTHFKLHYYTFITSNQTRNSDFITHLKTTWNFLETNKIIYNEPIEISQNLTQSLQLTIDKISSNELIGGIDFCSLKKLIKDLNLAATPYHSDVPTLQEWLAKKEVVQRIEQHTHTFHILKNWKIKGIENCEILDQKIAKWRTFIQATDPKIVLQTLEDLELKIHQYARCQLLENEIYKKYAPIYQFKNKRKEFEKLRTKYLQQRKINAGLEIEKTTWKREPTWSEIQSWEQRSNTHWWKRRKIEKEIQKRLNNDSIDLEIALKNWKEYLIETKRLQALEVQLLALGIERPELELDGIQYILHQLDEESPNELNEVNKIESNTRQLIIQLGPELIQLKQELSQYFQLDKKRNLLAQLTDINQNLTQILSIKTDVEQLSLQLFKLLQETVTSEELEAIISASTWKKLAGLFPALVEFDGEILHQKLDEISAQQTLEQTAFSSSIHQQQQLHFLQYHTLLRTPVNKLTPELLALKKKLKIGKAILVKEFSKSKQHKTIRELLASEARVWIELLTPIWFSTPTQVAQNFPMEKELFEWVIFDEASQIPLPNALGSLQRAKKAIVAGDEHQMSPSAYFTGQKIQVDLLHQASYYWEKIKLKHHYRSAHPSLIQFSNTHFYHNELIAYPSAWNRSQPIHWHYLPHGKYIDRQNELEAREIASLIGKYCQDDASLGIVAFSRTQLNCIWNALDARLQQQLQAKIEQGKGFFRALEHVQGDECDRLIISLGYGKNADNEFHMRFGPLNQSSGAKRLNVLFSRAKETIHFVSSVKTADFPLSTNEGINLLKNYIYILENEVQQDQLVFPFGLQPIVSGRKLTFENIHQTIHQVEELLTLHEVLKSRGWDIRYEI